MIGEPDPITTWAGRTMSVQLPSPFLPQGRLPVMAVGDVLDAAPVLWMSRYSPVFDESAGSAARRRPELRARRGGPADPAQLDQPRPVPVALLPDPWDVRPGETYVADLVGAGEG